MALYERVTLKLRKWNAVFVALCIPHASDCMSIGVAEAVDDFRVVSEMIVQRGPLGRERFLHGTNTPAHVCARRAPL